MNQFLNSPWPYLITASFVAMLGFYAWNQPHRPGSRYFNRLLWLWWGMTLVAALRTNIHTTELHYRLWALISIGTLLVAPMELLFSLTYIGNDKWLNNRSLILLFLPALIFGLLSITFPMNYLVSVETHFGIEMIHPNELIKWILLVTNIAIWLINVIVLGAGLLRAPAFDVPIGIIILGQAIPRVALVIDPKLIDIPPLQIPILFSSFTAMAYLVALYNFRLLRVMPVAWDKAISYTPQAMIVLDPDNFLIAFNPAAQALPGLPGKLALRHPAAKALGEWWERICSLIGPEQISQVISVQTSTGQQHFQVNSMPLLHISGWRMGQYVILEDITQAQQAQQRQLQTLWKEATQQERELLANELHDGLAQSLAFLNLQAQATQVQIQTGQSQAASASLDRLTYAASQIQDNIRELIDDLLMISLPANNFYEILCQILTNFKQQTGLMVNLEVDEDMIANDYFSQSKLPPPIVAQLVRMTQEALANVRKHARGASMVSVQFKASDGHLFLSIKDDGNGFDPEAQRNIQKQFGLQIMHQRAARIGGQITIYSTPGNGTRVEICAPFA